MKKSLRIPLTKKDPVLEKFHFFLIWFVRITFLLAIYRSIITQNWHVLAIVLVALIFTFLVFFIERRHKIDIPIEFEIGIVFLLYGSIFLGEVNKYYSEFWWWDLALRTLTGLIIGFVGFIILLILSTRKSVIIAPGTIALFSFSLAAAIGGIWEIFEFSMDQLFGFNMQKSGLADTMGDLIVTDFGALCASLIGYFYLKGRQTPFINRIVQRFKKENPRMAKEIPRISLSK
ncbi:MAG: hypothetical protein ACP5NS_00240 [Candidatus Pacearchaeota archaeon]